MRLISLVAAIPILILPTGAALAVDACNIAGQPAIFGANNTEAFDVKVGQGCMHGMRVRGTLANSQISQKAQHGTVRLTDKDTWVYEPSAGYRGPDTFAITTTGKSIDEKPGTSVITFKVNVN